ncbi:MAG: LD-carboxypeptidase [Planctomycetes bacterium]|nr:LD-carboxypeptidase [Planctomycetota bacterium]
MARASARPVCYVTAPSWPARSPMEAEEVSSALAPVAAACGFLIEVSPIMRQVWAGHGAWSDPAERIADLERAVQRELVWSHRGGFGCIQLIPAALNLRPAERPGFAGYSDNTVLHALWWKQGWEEAFYTGRPPRHPASRQLTSLITVMRGEGLRLSQHDTLGVRPLVDGEAEGRLFVACLSVLAHLAGTPLQPDLSGAILCLEDVDEKPYNVEFALCQLHLAGMLRGVRGLACGFFTYSEKSEYSGPHIDAVLRAWGERLGIPVIDRLPFGHIDDHLVLPTGRAACLRVRGPQWSLELAERPRPPWLI